MGYTIYQFKDLTDTQAELLTALLAEQGFDGFEEGDGELKAYLDETQHGKLSLRTLLESYPLLAELQYTTAPLPDKNWNDVWESNYQPIRIGDKVYIRADFHPQVQGIEHELRINPKMSFGTGHHETTQMMVEMMLQLDLDGQQVLDFGSGTGVLAILAEKMGAKAIVAVDIEQWAYENAVENVEANNCTHVEVLKGDHRAVPHRAYDVVLANVNRGVIMDIMSWFPQQVKDGGTLLLSGLLKEDEDAVTAAATSKGFTFQAKAQKGNWICLKFKG